VGARFQSILTVIKIGGLFILTFLLFKSGSGSVESGAANLVDASPVRGFSRALIPIFFAYTGWNVAGYIAGEIHNPRKTLPRALIGGTLITMIIYIVVEIGFLKSIGLDAMRGEEMVPVIALKTVGAEGWSTFLTLLIFISVVSSLSITIQTAGARVIQAMGEHGVFFRFTAKRHPRFQTPVNALILQAAWCIVLMYVLDIESLVDSTTVVMILFSSVSISTLFKVRGRSVADGNSESYKTPLFPLVPVAYIICALFVSWGVIRFHLDRGSLLPAWGFAFLVVGSIVYWIWNQLGGGSSENED
jgi:APA family basic amino acid/polyamine antiporter